MKISRYKISSIIVLFIFYSFGIRAQGTLTLLGQLNLPGMSYDVWGYVDTSSGKEYAIVGNNGLTIIDVSDPMNPVQVANLNTVPDFDIKVWSNYAYCVTGGPGTGSIVNIADPANPVIVNTFPSSHNIFIDDNGYMYAEYPGLIIYDLNPDPVNPVMIWTDSTTDGHDASVIGNRLFDFHGTSGTYIYDVCNPASPLLLGSITDPAIQYHHNGWTSKDGNYLYICDELAVAPSPDITVWDISNPDSAIKVGSFTDNSAIVHNLFVIGDYAYASYYTAGLRVFDLTDPTSPTIADEYDTSPLSGEVFGGAFGVYPFALNNKIFVLDEDSGLFIFNVTDTISGNCSANFIFCTDSSLTVIFKDFSSSAAFWSWDFNEDSIIDTTIQNLSWTFAAPGSYNVCLTISDSTLTCSDTICKIVTIIPVSCFADFAFFTDSSSLTVTFNDSSSNVFSWNWDFNGDGITDTTIPNPAWTFPFPGSYNVCLTIGDSGFCSDSICKLVIVMPTGIDQYSIINPEYSRLEVYPNPNTGKFFVTITNKEFQQNRGIHLIRVLSITGQLLYEEEISPAGRRVKQSDGLIIRKFDLTSRPQGIYILQLVTEKEVIHRRFLLLKSQY